MTLHYHYAVFIILLCASKSYNKDVRCPELSNGYPGYILRANLTLSQNPTNKGNIVGTCEYTKYPENNINYTIDAYIGDKQIGHCNTKNTLTNPMCEINYKPQPLDIGTPRCYAAVRLQDGTTGSCIAPMDFVIGDEKLIYESCPFYDDKMLKVGIETRGTSVSCYIFPSEHVTVSEVEWLLDNKQIQNCRPNHLKRFGNDYRCDLIDEASAGKLVCKVTGAVWVPSAGDTNYGGICEAAVELEDGKFLKLENEKVGRLKWGPNKTASTITGGALFKSWCKIEDLLPDFEYSYIWMFKTLDHPDGKTIVKKCSEKKYDVHKNNYYIFCGMDSVYLPMYEEGDIICRAIFKDDKDDFHTSDSDVIYKVKSHPHIELAFNLSNDETYLEANCSVMKFEGYSLKWTSEGEQLASEDYESCGNKTHSCTRLRRQFTSSTAVSCEYWGSKNIEHKDISVTIKPPTTTIPTTLPTTTKKTITSTNVPSTTTKSILPATKKTVPITSTAMLSTTKKAALSTPTTVSSKTEKTTTTSTGANQPNTFRGKNKKKPKPSSKLSSKTTHPPSTTVPSTKIPSTTSPSTTIPSPKTTSTTIPSNNMSSTPIGESTIENNTVNFGAEGNLIQRSSKNKDDENNMRPCEESCGRSCIATIVGVVMTILGNALACSVYYARKRGCFDREREEPNTRCGASNGYPEEPAYSIPHKWLSRPSKKEPAVTYTSLDLMPSASWAGRDEVPYAEIVGVEKPEYAEVDRPPVYTNLMDGEPEYTNAVNTNSNAAVSPDAVYAVVLPKSSRKK